MGGVRTPASGSLSFPRQVRPLARAFRAGYDSRWAAESSFTTSWFVINFRKVCVQLSGNRWAPSQVAGPSVPSPAPLPCQLCNNCNSQLPTTDSTNTIQPIDPALAAVSVHPNPIFLALPHAIFGVGGRSAHVAVLRMATTLSLQEECR